MNGLFCKAEALIGGCWCILQSACWVVGGAAGEGGDPIGAYWWCILQSSCYDGGGVMVQHRCELCRGHTEL